MKRIYIVFIILMNISLIGCSKPNMGGIVLGVTENQIKVATELSSSDYKKIKHKTVSQIQNDDVLGDSYYGLIDLTYDNTGEFSKGDEIEIWIDGDIMTSYPSQAKAKKISHKE